MENALSNNGSEKVNNCGSEGVNNALYGCNVSSFLCIGGKNVDEVFISVVEEVIEEVQEKVKTSIETMTNLEVVDVNVRIASVVVPAAE